MRSIFYTVIENQQQAGGGRALLHSHFDDVNQAYASYYTICAAAAVSAIPYHAVCIIRSDGVMIEGRVWDRRTEEAPTPAEEPEG